MKITAGYCFSFGSWMFSCCSRKQDIVAQSTTEAEYVAAIVAKNQAIWSGKYLMARLKRFKIKLYILKEV